MKVFRSKVVYAIISIAITFVPVSSMFDNGTQVC